MSGVARKIRSVMLLQVAAAAVAGWAANAVSGDSTFAWLVALGGLVLIAAVLAFLLERNLVGRLNGLRHAIASMYAAVSYTHLDVYKRQGRWWPAPALAGSRSLARFSRRFSR